MSRHITLVVSDCTGVLSPVSFICNFKLLKRIYVIESPKMDGTGVNQATMRDMVT